MHQLHDDQKLELNEENEAMKEVKFPRNYAKKLFFYYKIIPFNQGISCSFPMLRDSFANGLTYTGNQLLECSDFVVNP